MTKTVNIEAITARLKDDYFGDRGPFEGTTDPLRQAIDDVEGLLAENSRLMHDIEAGSAEIARLRGLQTGAVAKAYAAEADALLKTFFPSGSAAGAHISAHGATVSALHKFLTGIAQLPQSDEPRAPLGLHLYQQEPEWRWHQECLCQRCRDETARRVAAQNQKPGSGVVTKERGPYILQSDNSGHHYVIPKARAADWNTWLSIPEDDERSWEVPEYAEEIGGSPTLVTFDSYTIR